MSRFKMIADDFSRALGRLEPALGRESNDQLMQAGCIKYFEFCFELAWKTIKAAPWIKDGRTVSRPKAVLNGLLPPAG